MKATTWSLPPRWAAVGRWPARAGASYRLELHELVHRLHPSPPARLAVYALFAFLLGLQAFLAPTKGAAISVVAIFCLAVSFILAVIAISVSFATPAPLTASPPPSASSALTAFLVTTWLAPFHYIVFYLALLALAAMVTIPANVFHLSESWLAFLRQSGFLKVEEQADDGDGGNLGGQNV